MGRSRTQQVFSLSWGKEKKKKKERGQGKGEERHARKDAKLHFIKQKKQPEAMNSQKKRKAVLGNQERRKISDLLMFWECKNHVQWDYI